MTVKTRRNKPRAAATGAIERLYMMYFAGIIFVLLAIIVLAVFTTSRLARQAAHYGEIVERLTTLQSEIERWGGHRANAPARAAEERTSNAAPTRVPTSQPAPRSAPATAQPRSVLDSKAIMSLFGQCVRTAHFGLFEIVDADQARALYDRAIAALDAQQSNAWNGPALVSLAVLSRLLADEDHARRFSSQARRAGFDTSVYDEFTARALLDAGRPAEAELFARALRQSEQRGLRGAVLQAAALAARRNLNAARTALPKLSEIGALADYDRLLLAGVLVELERWGDLQTALAGLDEIDADLTYQRDLLRSIWLISNGSLAEADAVLAFLLEQEPGDYTAMTWRGVVLARTSQPEAAREVFVKATELAAGRPEAWYRLAVLEINSKNDAEAEQYLNKALAASALYAPAWEALANIAIENDELDTALNHLKAAFRHDSARPGAHLMAALCYAKKSQRAPAAAALKTTFALDPTLIEQAAGMEALSSMFDRSEMEALLPQTRSDSGPTTQPVRP